jgi:hypothetical protein
MMTLFPRSSSILLLLLIIQACTNGQHVKSNGFNITTNDPQLINDDVNAYTNSLFTATPPEDIVVLRTDWIMDALAEYAMENIVEEDDQIQYMLNAMVSTSIWNGVLLDGQTGEVDKWRFAASLLDLLPGNYGVDPYPNFLESREEALEVQQQRNFSQEILLGYHDVLQLYGTTTDLPFEAAPIYQVSYGYQDATGVATAGSIQGRCWIWINLGANRMLNPSYFMSGFIHETWHCFQSPTGTTPTTLLEIVLREGVVMYLTSMVDPSISETDILLWSEEELEAAKEQRDALVDAFGEVRTTTDASQIAQWYYLGVVPSNVPEAPSRSGYYIGLLAIQAYVSNNYDNLIEGGESSLARHLLTVTDSEQGREDIWQALSTQQQSQPDGTLQQQSQPDGALPPSGTPTSLAQIKWWIFVSLISLVATMCLV